VTVRTVRKYDWGGPSVMELIKGVFFAQSVCGREGTWQGHRET
jgi:hypothetical protein